MKQLVWSPSSINFGSKKKGESVTAESTLSITEGSALLTPGKISPLPGADYPVQIKNTEGNLHIHPAFSFAAARYYLTSAGALTTDRDTAEIYLGNAGAGAGLPFLPVPITLVITTPPGEIDPADPLTINYTSSAVLWVSVFLSINGSEWFFYDTFNATGTLDIDLSGWSLEHGDIITVKVQDSESSSFYDTVDLTAMVKNIVIDGIGTIYLIGEFEDGVDYYATPDGEITTDITGIHLGVGNADGDIDLDIIEYAVEITSPVASADIGLNVPFTFEATTNVQDGRSLTVVAYSAEVPSGVALRVFEISGGAITGSVTVSESDGFTTGAVQLLAWYSPVVSTIDTVDVTAQTATITNVTSTPASPEPATNFELSGESTYLVGKELTLQYSTDDSTWLPLGVATVQGDGTWSKADCQIATAGTYYLRAIYGAEVVESASLSVVVASGVIALLFGGSGDDFMSFCEEQSDGTFIVVGRTKSSTMFGVNTYPAGLTRDNSKYCIFANRLNADGTQFSGFTPYFVGGCTNAGGATDTQQIDASGTYGLLGLVLSTSIYMIITAGYGGAREGIRKLNISTGAVEASINLTNQSTNQPFDGVITDGAYIYTFGSKTTSGSPRPTVWRYPLDLSSETALINASDDLGSAARSCSVCGTKLVFSSSNGTHRYTLTGTKETYNTTIKRGANYGGFNLGSSTRWYVHSTSDTKIYCYAVSDFSELWNQSITNSSQGIFRVLDNGNIAMAQEKNGTPDSFDITTFQDANSYTNVSTSTTALSDGVISLEVRPLNKGGASSSLDGKLVADSTDAGGYDCFVYEE